MNCHVAPRDGRGSSCTISDAIVTCRGEEGKQRRPARLEVYLALHASKPIVKKPPTRVDLALPRPVEQHDRTVTEVAVVWRFSAGAAAKNWAALLPTKAASESDANAQPRVVGDALGATHDIVAGREDRRVTVTWIERSPTHSHP